MCRACVFVLLLAALLLAGCNVKDEFNKVALPGTWDESDPDGSYTIRTTFHSDGTWVANIVTHGFLATVFIGDANCSGTWQIIDGRLKETVTQSTNKTFPAGYTSSDQIVDLSATKLTLRSDTGTVSTSHRVQ